MTSFSVYNAFSAVNSENLIWLAGIPDQWGADRCDDIVNRDLEFSTWAFAYATPFVIPTNTYRIWMDRMDTNLTTLNMFDVSPNSATNFNAAMSNAIAPAPGCYIGGVDSSLPNVGSGRNFNGDIVELICYRGALTEGDRLAVVNYLEQKYYQTGVGGSLSYQWQFDGTNIAGATNMSLTLSNVQFANAGDYSVTVSNVVGVITSSNAVLTVEPSPPCAPPPSGLISWWPAEGNANDVAGLNNGSLMNGASFGSGEVGQAFALNGVNQYIAIPDSPSLRPASLTVEGWVNFQGFASAQVLFAKPYGSATWDSWAVWYSGGQLWAGIATTSDDAPYLSYSWAFAAGAWHHVAYTFDADAFYQALYVDGALVASGARSGPIAYDSNPMQIGADINNGVLGLFFDGKIDETSFYNRALSPAEVASIYTAASAGKCGPPPAILIQPQSQNALPGGSAAFSVTAGGKPPLNYQWQFDGTNISGATNMSLSLANVRCANAGSYTVIVSNLAGSATSSNALLTVVLPPMIAMQPASQSVESNCTATFNVSAWSAEPMSYQWRLNGLALAAQTNSILAIPEVQATNFGSYSVVISNVFGATTSAVAVLALASPPVAYPDTILRFAEGGVRVNAADLTSNDTVALYDDLTVVAVSPNSAAGGVVSLVGPWIYYTPPVGGVVSDTFAYMLSDGHCGTSIGTVTVKLKADNPQPLHFAICGMGNGSFQLTFDGIPGCAYHLECSDSLSPPNWRVLTNQAADAFGVLQFADCPPASAPARFYRVVCP
jgi:hypothetical protein